MAHDEGAWRQCEKCWEPAIKDELCAKHQHGDPDPDPDPQGDGTEGDYEGGNGGGFGDPEC
jgi:hypothetical protein